MTMWQRLIGLYEIRAVLSGTDAADEAFDKIIERTKGIKEEVETKGAEEIQNTHEIKNGTQAEKKSSLDFFSSIKNLKKAVKIYHEESKQDKAEQHSFIIEMLRLYYGRKAWRLTSVKNTRTKI